MNDAKLTTTIRQWLNLTRRLSPDLIVASGMLSEAADTITRLTAERQELADLLMTALPILADYPGDLDFKRTCYRAARQPAYRIGTIWHAISDGDTVDRWIEAIGDQIDEVLRFDKEVGDE